MRDYAQKIQTYKSKTKQTQIKPIKIKIKKPEIYILLYSSYFSFNNFFNVLSSWSLIEVIILYILIII